MINSVAGINIVMFFDNFFTIGVVAAILIWYVMDVMWAGTWIHTIFHYVIRIFQHG